jgi:large subunit ribosomal protein L24
MKLKKGDRVVVLAGKDRGKDGTVMRVIPEAEKVIVEGVNMAKKHQRPTRATMQGGIIDKDMPIHVSNVALWCSSCKKGVRVGFRFDANGRKVRICRKCGGDV